MSNQQNIKLLEKILKKSDNVKIENSSDSSFKSWKNLVERTLISVFGKDSTEVIHFNELKFYYPAMFFTETSDYTNDHLRVFREDFKILKESIQQYIDDFKEEVVEDDIEPTNNDILSRIFISHSSKDAGIVEEIIDLLELMGLDSAQIFCSSFEGYGVELGENFLDVIKDELSSDCMVIFVISEYFYKSPICLCEMGASWVLAKEHIPIIIPPIEFSDIKAIIPTTQGLKVNDPLKFNLLKEKIQKLFNIQEHQSISTWERKRDRVLARIEQMIPLND